MIIPHLLANKSFGNQALTRGRIKKKAKERKRKEKGISKKSTKVFTLKRVREKKRLTIKEKEYRFEAAVH